jgi:hypothetical protein
VVILKEIRKKAGRYILNHRISKFSRKKEFIGIQAALTIGILFHHIDNDSLRSVHDFIKKLTKEGKQVIAIGYIETKEIPDFYLLKRGFDFFCLKDLNWHYKPEAEFLQDFTDREFDLLINLSMDNFFPVEYIYALSRAKFKAGRYTPDYDYDDMTIDIKDNRDVKFLIQQISHYLGLIKSKPQVKTDYV